MKLNELYSKLHFLESQKQSIEKEILETKQVIEKLSPFSKQQKISLFKSLFVAREDVYPTYWISKDGGGGGSFFAGIAGGSFDTYRADVYGPNGHESGVFMQICLGIGLGIEGNIGSNGGVCEVDNNINDLEGWSIGGGGGMSFNTDGASGDFQIGAHSLSGSTDGGVLPSIGLGAHGGIKGCYTVRVR
jgi:hypothetical protein